MAQPNRIVRRVIHICAVQTVHPGRLRGKKNSGDYRESRSRAKGGYRLDADLRFNVPLFLIEEAAQHLGLPASTLRSWTRRQAGPAPLVHRLQPETPRSASLPFVGLVEAHMLRGFRELGLSAQGLRVSVTRLRNQFADEYALATRRLATDGVSLLVDMAASHDEPMWTRAIDGQAVIPEVIDRYLKFVTWSKKDGYPARLRLKTYEGADVIIDPRFAFGQPVLERQKIRVQDILDAFWAGESPHTVAAELGVKTDEVEAVIRSATRRHAA
jgi:uncharacterized protein (DUF433 family)